MRNATNIRICNDKVILHILDPKHDHNGTVISSRSISLTGNDALGAFFRDHIHNGLKDSTSKGAKFRIFNKDLPSGICSNLINLHLPLVQGSQRLAEILNIVMDNNHNISSGDLVVCLFEVDNLPGRLLAILKIDPSDAYLQRTLQDDQGNIYNDIQLQPNALPSTRERLQKCAFIRQPTRNNQDYDMLLLDRQSSADQGQQIARFFIKDFLDAEYALDPTQRTQKMYDALISARTQIHPTLSRDEIEDFDTRIRTVITSASVNLDEWVNQLPFRDEQKAVINQMLMATMPDREFDIDGDFGRKLSQKRKFKAESGFRLTLNADDFNHIVKESEWFVDEATHTRRHRLLIVTNEWDEISNHG